MQDQPKRNLKGTLHDLVQTLEGYGEDNDRNKLQELIKTSSGEGEVDKKKITELVSECIETNIGPHMIKPILKESGDGTPALVSYLRDFDQVLKVGLEAKKWKKQGKQYVEQAMDRFQKAAEDLRATSSLMQSASADKLSTFLSRFVEGAEQYLDVSQNNLEELWGKIANVGGEKQDKPEKINVSAVIRYMEGENKRLEDSDELVSLKRIAGTWWDNYKTPSFGRPFMGTDAAHLQTAKGLNEWIDGLVKTVETSSYCTAKFSIFSRSGKGRWDALKKVMGPEKFTKLRGNLKECLNEQNTYRNTRAVLVKALRKEGLALLESEQPKDERKP